MSKSYDGTPEKYLVVSKENKMDDDALGCAVSRAQSLNFLIMSHFSDPEATKWNDLIMTNACWTLQGLLEQIEILIDGKENNHEQ